MDLKKTIREFPDFPKPGILFRDISPVLKNPQLMEYIIEQFYQYYQHKKIDLIAGAESRGLLFASLLGQRFGVGSIMVRKKGKLPGPTVDVAYDIEYGNAVMEIQIDAVEKGQNVLIIDDLLATGGTARAAAHLIEKVGGKVAGFAFLVELADLNGQELIKEYDTKILVSY
jgi:adenine phosphoribosyltransferase